MTLISGAGWEAVDPSFTVCRSGKPWEDYCVQPPCGQLNPTSDGMYRVLQTIFTDMLSMFQPTTFHMGGDEIHVGCWNSSELITDWLQEQVDRFSLNKIQVICKGSWNK